MQCLGRIQCSGFFFFSFSVPLFNFYLLLFIFFFFLPLLGELVNVVVAETTLSSVRVASWTSCNCPQTDKCNISPCPKCNDCIKDQMPPSVLFSLGREIGHLHNKHLAHSSDEDRARDRRWGNGWEATYRLVPTQRKNSASALRNVMDGVPHALQVEQFHPVTWSLTIILHYYMII